MNSIEGRTEVSGSKISIAMAATALLVSVLVATPLGQAASRLVLPKNSVGAKQLKKNAITGAKVKDGTLLAADFKAGQLPAGPKGDKGDPGAQGQPGKDGAPGTARAYAVVTPAPALVAGRTKGFISVRRPQPGLYCLMPAAGIDWETHPAVVSAEWNNSHVTDMKAFPAATSRVFCVAPEYSVYTVHGTPPVMSNLVAFSVIVP